ncbi:MAG: four-carbon acid sugar kinase family protein [Mediterranea sp.]|jgi:uncharacterized protein YgbK (DUF1537 family)|nr:four-carbon acid sugar kinase family protein [Mediterranea sp.]
MLTINHPLIVIADDITGAAEIAGIGFRFGFKVNLIMYNGEETITCPEGYDMLVLATDTRSMTEAEAIEETVRIAEAVKRMGFTFIFKKTDSVLRGHIAAELKTLMDVTGIEYARLIPQNPSMGRTIVKGIYYINHVPLSKTKFASDPEFPAETADVMLLLFYKYRGYKYRGTILTPRKTTERKGIFLAEAATIKEIERRGAEINEGVLAAGGADFFTACLTVKGYTPNVLAPFEGLQGKPTLIIQGSPKSKSLANFSYIQQQNTIQRNMPMILFHREIPTRWAEKLKKEYTSHDLMILRFEDYSYRKSERAQKAQKLREEMGKAVIVLLSERLPQELIIEGGATAFSILKRTAWNTFDVTGEVAPGIVRMTPVGNPGVTITLKPGSYPWENLFL